MHFLLPAFAFAGITLDSMQEGSGEFVLARCRCKGNQSSSGKVSAWTKGTLLALGSSTRYHSSHGQDKLCERLFR